MPYIDWGKTHQDGHGLSAWFIRWLRRDRWFTDREGAEQSRWIYSEVSPGRYGTSILGVINGILPCFGIVLVCHFIPGGGPPMPPYLSIKRRWW